MKNMLSFSFYSVISLIGYTLAYASDAIIAGRLLSTVEVAQLGLGLSVVAMISGVIGAFSQNFMPLASGLASQDRLDRLRTAYLLGSRWCLLLAVPCVLLGLGWGPDLMRLWVGAELGTPAGALLGLLLLAYLPPMANSVGFQMGIGAELHRHGAVLSLAEGVLKVALGVLLAVRFGLPGLVAGSLVSAFIFHGLAWPALLRARLALPWHDLLRHAVLPAIWPALPAMLAGLLLGRALPDRVPLVAPLVVAVVYSSIVVWTNRRDLRGAVAGVRPNALALGDNVKRHSA
jgi:O-antigen/teichoic acid export membrane protein